MQTKQYREARARANKEIEWLKQHKEYESVKSSFRAAVFSFGATDDLMDLAEAMKRGNDILEQQEFPTREYIKYKTNAKKTKSKNINI